MEVIYNKENDKNSKIKLGDLFVNKSDNEVYMLIDVSSMDYDDVIEFPVILQNLDGEGSHDSYKSVESMIKEYDVDLFNYLDWFPKDQYSLELKRK